MAEHPSRPGLSPRYSRLLRFLLPLVAIIVLLAGCGEGYCNCYNMQFPIVRVPHVQPIKGLDNTLLSAAQKDYFNTHGTILGLATSTSRDGAGQLFASLGGTLYAMALPGGQAIAVSGLTCSGATLSLTSNGSRLACLSSPTPQLNSKYGCTNICVSEQLQVANFISGDKALLVLQKAITAEAENAFSSPTWRPDGGALAALEFVNPDVPYIPNDTRPFCKIAMYAQVSPTNLSLIPALSLTEAGVSLCDALQLAWSPDGRTLAVLTKDKLIFVMAPSPDVVAKAASTGHFVRSTITINQQITLRDSARAMAWAPNGKSVAVLSRDFENNLDVVNQYPLDASTSPATLFKLPTIVQDKLTTYPAIGPITYSADGSMLLFAYGMREAQLVSEPPPIADDSPTFHRGSFTAHAPGSVVRPLVCLCPYPPTGLYAYTLPTS